MNNKYLFQCVVYILLGFTAMAGPGRYAKPNTGDHPEHATAAVIKSFVTGDEDRVVYACNLPTKKQPKIRTRFRAVSYVRISPIETSEPVEHSFPVSITTLCNCKTAHLPPFYYVFLFRLTPF